LLRGRRRGTRRSLPSDLIKSHRISPQSLKDGASAQQKTYVDCREMRDCLPSGSLRNSDLLGSMILGGSAPRLRYFHLDAVQFLSLPILLLSSTHLVRLYLQRVPHSGYISPETMATCLSMLTSLMDLRLEFESPESSPDQEGRRSPSITRSVLPDLTFFRSKGSTNTWRNLWPGSMLLNSTTSR
jgi:hypothetical protein